MNDQQVAFLATVSVTVAASGFYFLWRVLEWLDARGHLATPPAEPREPAASATVEGDVPVEDASHVLAESCAA